MIEPLPLWPSSRARATLSPSQQASLYAKIASALSQTLALPPSKRDTPQSRSFVASYLRDAALSALETVQWSTERARRTSPIESIIRIRTLGLAEKLASSTSVTLDIDILLDLSIAYPRSKRPQFIWATALASNPNLEKDVKEVLVPSFAALLDPQRLITLGLSGARRSSYVFLCLLHALPPLLRRHFSADAPLALSVARAYDAGLGALAVNYGGPPDPTRSSSLDEDQRMWLETKAALLDAFHILLRSQIERLAAASGSLLPSAVDTVFSVIFALLDEEGASEPSGHQAGVPFSSRGLLADYQQAYSLRSTLQTALSKVAVDDKRLNELDASLRAFESIDRQDAGALKLLLQSSGRPIIPPSDNSSVPIVPSSSALPLKADDGKLEAQISQVLEVLPDADSTHIRMLLRTPDQPFTGNPERVVEALLDGSAPSLDELRLTEEDQREQWVYTANRANVFDGEIMDQSLLRVGKKTDNADSLLHSNAERDALKSGILARVAAMDEAEEQWNDENEDTGAGRDLAYEDELEENVRVIGDGEADDSGSEEGGAEAREMSSAGPSKTNLETILELAYLEDSSVFNRDTAARRGAARARLRAQTGWDNEQIEGWRIMLERNPHKDKILQKHEFAGNKPLKVESTDEESNGEATPAARGRGGGRGGGRGRGGGGGKGRGGRGGGRGTGVGGNSNESRDRARKERRGNQNRKRGHDKKMARAGGGEPS